MLQNRQIKRPVQKNPTPVAIKNLGRGNPSFFGDKMKKFFSTISIVLIFCLCFTGCVNTQTNSNISTTDSYISSVNEVPDFTNSSYIEIKDSVPDFTQNQLTTNAFENYSELDILGRCGVAFACIGKELMPTEEREGIGQIKPSGWQTVKYDIVDGKYLYNRCHLIGFQLAGENANEKNLITGTRYMNVEGMLPFENEIADYVKETNNHVLYRVTPIFDGANLVARGVQLEAMSVEDGGKGVCFNVYVYNNQPGIKIDYATGKSTLIGGTESIATDEKTQYIVNINTRKFHLPSCKNAKDIKAENRKEYIGTRQQLENNGYSPCKLCLG